MSETEGGGHAEAGEGMKNGLEVLGMTDSIWGMAEGAAPEMIEGLEHVSPYLGPTVSGLLGPLGAIGGGIEVASGGSELMDGNLNGLTEMARGGAGIVSGAGTTAALAVETYGAAALPGAVGAIAEAGPVGAAAGAGLLVGSGAAALQDSKETATGFWGNDAATGAPRTGMEFAADTGIAANTALGLSPGNLVGGAIGVETGMITAPMAAGQALFNYFAD